MAAQEGAAGGPQVTRIRYGDVGDSNFAVHGRVVPLLVGLLCALVLFVALCFYLRWRCGSRTADLEAANTSSSTAAAATPSLPGLDTEAIRGLPVTLYRAPTSSPPRLAGKGDDRTEALCSICIGALVPGEKVKVLPPCGHCFHPECVDLWLRSHPSCPLCRCHLLLTAKPEVNGNDEAV